MTGFLRNFLPHEIEEITHYRLENLVIMFFIFALIGYIWEIIYTAVTEKVVANRGMLHGPWVPLYGVGGVLILVLLGRFQANPPLVFFLAAIMCTVIEYSTGILVEKVYGKRWWDYSTKRINFQGRICLSGIILFGSAGALAVCGFGPSLNNAISSIPSTIHTTLAVTLVLFFVVDVIYSAKHPNKGSGVTYALPEEKKTEEHIQEKNTVE